MKTGQGLETVIAEIETARRPRHGGLIRPAGALA